MILNERGTAGKLTSAKSLFNLWMIVAALMVVITMVAGWTTAAQASDMVDPIKTSAIAAAPISQASDRILVILLLASGFLTMATAGILLTINSVRNSAGGRRRN